MNSTNASNVNSVKHDDNMISDSTHRRRQRVRKRRLQKQEEGSTLPSTDNSDDTTTSTTALTASIGNEITLVSTTDSGITHLEKSRVSSSTTPATATASEITQLLSKKERGRYKKLMKRVTYATANCNTKTDASAIDNKNTNNTGICTLQDWIELQQLHDKSLLNQRSQQQQPVHSTQQQRQLPGMQILQHQQYQHSYNHVTNRNSESSIAAAVAAAAATSCDASRHRHLLLQLTQIIKVKQQQQSGNSLHVDKTNSSDTNQVKRIKTDRDDDASILLVDDGEVDDPDDDIPYINTSFHHNSNSNHTVKGLSMHNCMALSHIAIIEIHMNSREDASVLIQSIMGMEPKDSTVMASPSSTVCNTILTQNCNINVAVVPTYWFHTNQMESQSITDVLMYRTTDTATTTTTTTKTAKGEHKKKKLISTTIVDLTDKHEYDDTSHLNANKNIERHELAYCNDTNDNGIDRSNNSLMNRTIKELESHILTLPQLKDSYYPIPFNDDFGSTENTKKCIVPIKERCEIMELHHAQSFVQSYQCKTICTYADDANYGGDSDKKAQSEDDDSQLAPFVRCLHDSKISITATNQDRRDQATQQQRRRLFCIDCEMVETNYINKELARISICEMISCVASNLVLGDNENDDVDSINIKVVTHLDAIVQPRNHITNYLTKYSGISAESYKKTEDNNLNILRLEQVQAFLLQLIHPNDLVVGHSLENDLHALRWIHLNVIDTAIMFQGTNKRQQQQSQQPSLSSSTFKYSLRHLAAVLLKKQIQKVDGPHCSQEDAITALELAINRAIIGPSFNVTIMLSSNTNWLVNLSQQQSNKLSFPTVCVGPIKWLQQHILSPRSSNAIHALQCESIHDSNSKAICSWLTGPKRRACIVWSKVYCKSNATTISTDIYQSTSSSSLHQFIAWIQSLIGKLFITSNATVLMIPIQINHDSAKHLYKQRRIRRYDRRSSIPWSETDEKNYQSILETSRNGYVLYITRKT